MPRGFETPTGASGSHAYDMTPLQGKTQKWTTSPMRHNNTQAYADNPITNETTIHMGMN
jgi:hypothetical protein